MLEKERALNAKDAQEVPRLRQQVESLRAELDTARTIHPETPTRTIPRESSPVAFLYVHLHPLRVMCSPVDFSLYIVRHLALRPRALVAQVSLRVVLSLLSFARNPDP